MTIINSVLTGKQPSGTITISSNTTTNVADYEFAVTQVPTTAPEYYVKLTLSTPPSAQLCVAYDSPVINMSGVKDITNYVLACAYLSNNLAGNEDWSSIEHLYEYSCVQCFKWSTITSIDLSSLQTIDSNGAKEMFYGCHRLQTNINLSSLTTVADSGLLSAFENSKITGLDMSGLVSLNQLRACYKMCASCTALTSVDLSSLTTINGESLFSTAFAMCTALTNVDLSSLTTISGTFACSSMFEGCTALTNVDLSSLTTISSNYACGSMFKGCTSLQMVDLTGLVSVTNNATNNMFMGCTSLQRVKLSDGLTKRNPTNILDNVPVQTCEYADKLEYITGQVTGLCQGNRFATADMKKLELVNIQATYMFANNTNLTDIKFPVLTRWNGLGYATNMFSGCTNANFTDVSFPMLCVFKNAVPFTTTSFPSQVTVHFRKDQQTVIMGTAGASSNFGAAALVFDQIGTITVGGVDYIRQGKCNETGYYAWQKATSNITVGGVVYTFNVSQITRNTVPETAGPIIYGWTNGSTIIYTDTLTPVVGDFIYTAFNAAQSTTPIDAVDNEFIYTVDSAEPDVGDTVYSDAQGTVLGTISAVA